ncbi:hypothetical protein [Confluentibacter flavum]|uniref:DUF1579 domain-containing protein n=1 Tax=Confluentibacter flavum TaxID=1909700 RepID=A0A2N3HID3_9FLAO|nr:hypothetical protein [Confluentibacter flavum]PKQ44727.1 hypothetical protein CSW08_11455 [Confluentibacter flavum]
MTQHLFFSLAIILFISNSNAQTNNLTPEQQRLTFIVGSWTIDGSEKTYIETCDWIQGNHLQCLSVDNENEKTRKSVSYFTYSPSEKIYIYYGLYSGGGSRTLRGSWIEDRFSFEGQQQTTDKLTRYRVTMKPNQGMIDFFEERSINNGEWKEIAKFQYKPAN